MRLDGFDLNRFVGNDRSSPSWIDDVDGSESGFKRADEEGNRALVQAIEPVNKFPAFVGYLIRRLETLCPTIGKKRIAQVNVTLGSWHTSVLVRETHLP